MNPLGAPCAPDRVVVRVGSQASHLYLHYSLDALGRTLCQHTDRRHAIVLADTTVADVYGERVRTSLAAAGFDVAVHRYAFANADKTLTAVERVYRDLAFSRADQGSVAVLLGGSVLIDSAGFAVSTYFRGIPYVVLPTTLLSQVDGGLGGTLGLHFGGMTNHVGLRNLPVLVLNDPSVLIALPGAEVRAGFAEIVKHAAIADPCLFEALERASPVDRLAAQHMSALMDRVARTKVDLLRTGTDGFLNYGHTFGQALEGVTGHRLLRHGEAVAIGMVVANEVAVRLDLLATDEAERIRTLLASCELPTSIPVPDVIRSAAPDCDLREALADAVSRDKKARGGLVSWVLPTAIGHCVTRSVSRGLVDDVIQWALANGGGGR